MYYVFLIDKQISKDNNEGEERIALQSLNRSLLEERGVNLTLAGV